MRKSEKEAEDIGNALRSNDIIAEVIKMSALWESHLDYFLAIEFAGPKRLDDFIDLVSPCMSLAQKIEALKKMKFHRQMKSHSNIVESLTRIRKIRNKLAHAHYLSNDDIKRIQSDRMLVKFVLGYPQSFLKEKKKLDNSFAHLWRSWEIQWKKDHKAAT